MLPLESEIYNIIFEAGEAGATSDEIHQRSQLAPNKKATIAAILTLEELGRIRCIIVDKKRRYVACTNQKAGSVSQPPPVSDDQKRPKQTSKKQAAPAKPKAQPIVQLLEQQAERSRVLLERYLDDINDPVLQSLINSVHELDMAVEAARGRAA